MNTIHTRVSIILIFSLLLAGCGKPIADFTMEQSPTQAPSTVTFKNNSKRATSYQWDFGDGNQSEEVNPSHKYYHSGEYAVILKAQKGEKEVQKEMKITVDIPQKCLVELETEFGNMTILLYDETPLHRDNFLKLADEGYYNDLLFHRVINGFMIQGGDPESKNASPDKRLGSGGPGYQIKAEFNDNLIHLKGALAAARTPNPAKKSSGSQFYIVQGTKLTDSKLKIIEARRGVRYTPEQREAYLKDGGTPHLDGEYTVFGQVVSGIEVMEKIAAVATDPSNRPLEDVKMKMKVIK